MDKLVFVPLAKIKVTKRTREDFGDMESMIESVRDKGIIQPITVNEHFELRAGERRLRAAKGAGLKEIPCLVRTDRDTVDGLEVELIENVWREDFNAFERAAHIAKLHEHCKKKNIDWSVRKTAKLLNHSHPMNVSRDLQLAAAVQVFPELKEAGTQDEALRMLKRMEEEVVVGELRRRQDVSKQRTGFDMVSIAKANYRIGDTFTGMAALKSGGEIHFIEVDPPYAIDLDTTKGGASQRARRDKTGADNSQLLAQNYNEVRKDDYPTFLKKIAAETYRVANKDCWMIFWFGPTHFELVKQTLLAAGWKVNDIPAIWVKSAGQTLAPEYNLANCYEPFFICRKGQPVLVLRGTGNVKIVDSTPGAQKYHPTERPLLLMDSILKTFCMPTQICLVPFLGSGVTLRACYLRGIKCFGWDKSKDYLDKFLLAVEEDMRTLDKEE